MKRSVPYAFGLVCGLVLAVVASLGFWRSRLSTNASVANAASPKAAAANQNGISVMVWGSDCISKVGKNIHTRLEAPIMNGMPDMKRALMVQAEVTFDRTCGHIEIRSPRNSQSSWWGIAFLANIDFTGKICSELFSELFLTRWLLPVNDSVLPNLYALNEAQFGFLPYGEG